LNTETPYSQIREQFSDHLRQKRQRCTPERLALLDYIYANEGYFTAEQLFAALKDTCRVSMATVYNTLNLLLECNLAVRHTFNGQNAFWERALYETPRHYFVCSRCGAAKGFADKKIRQSIKQKNFTNFNPTHYSLYIYGECKKCKKQK
jgi:Fur family ferric uptake transcriptional regulator